MGYLLAFHKGAHWLKRITENPTPTVVTVQENCIPGALNSLPAALQVWETLLCCSVDQPPAQVLFPASIHWRENCQVSASLAYKICLPSQSHEPPDHPQSPRNVSVTENLLHNMFTFLKHGFFIHSIPKWPLSAPDHVFRSLTWLWSHCTNLPLLLPLPPLCTAQLFSLQLFCT